MNNNDNYNTNISDGMVASIDENYNSISNQNPPATASGQALTGFEDSVAQKVVGTTGFPMPKLGAPDSSISEFLSRPVKVSSGASTGADFVLNPLKLYLDNPAVTRKIANYRYLRATVCIRYTEAAMPFVYGCRQLALQPFMTPSTYNRSTTFYELSHLACQYTNPTTAEPIVMKAPFLNNYMYWDIPAVKADTAAVWWYHVTNIMPYVRCDAATAPTTKYSVHVWLEDVELDLPVATDVIESEYHGVISTPATIVGDAARTLGKIPMLAPFTQPVEVASKLISGFARNFGFSKPLQLEPPQVYVDNPDHNMSLNTYLDVAQKLTMDPKQSVSVDTAFVDGARTDNLDFRNFYSRETFAYANDWAQTQAAGTIILTIPVTPCVFTDVSNNSCVLPSCALPVLPFRYWRGGMRYRLKVLSSAYHRGRLRVYWSPVLLNTTLTEDIFNQLESFIIDVESTSEAVIDVNYATRELMKKARFRAIQSTTNYGPDTVNGYLYVRVSQELSAPLSTAIAKVLVFISAHDDMEVNSKSGLNMGLFHLFPQPSTSCSYRSDGLLQFPATNLISKSVDFEYQSLAIGSKDIQRIQFNKQVDMSQIHSAVAGNTVRSFRELIKSWHLWETNTITAAYSGRQSMYVSFPPYPLLPGGYNASPTATGGLKLYDSPMTMLSSYFKGYRGGIRWKIIFDSYLPASTQFRVALIRQPNNYQRVTGCIEDAIENTSLLPLSYWDNNAVAVQRSGNSITFEIPYEFHLSFFSLPSAAAFGNGRSNALVYMFNTQSGTTVNEVISYRAYMSAAEDTSFSIYVGPGRSYFYSVFPNTTAPTLLPDNLITNSLEGGGSRTLDPDFRKTEILADYEAEPINPLEQ